MVILKANHSQPSMQNKTGYFIGKICKYKQKPRHLIGQTAISSRDHFMRSLKIGERISLIAPKELAILLSEFPKIKSKYTISTPIQYTFFQTS
jgi:hypothetical protein